MVSAAVGFILGTILGSLVLCLATRSLSQESFWGRSYCRHCRKRLRWYDLFPLFSYLSTGGKCRYCGTSLKIEYLLVEAGMGFLVGLLFYQTALLEKLSPPLLLPLADIFFRAFTICILVMVLLTDIKKGLIPDRITYPAVIISIIYLVIISLYQTVVLYLSLNSSELGKYLLPPHSDYFFRHALISSSPLLTGAGAAILLVSFFGALILITRGKGMGGGDLKLGAFMGLTLGFPGSVLALAIAFLSGSIAGLGLILSGKKRFGQTIPFGPFLSLGGIAVLFWGEQILKWYLGLKLGY